MMDQKLAIEGPIDAYVRVRVTENGGFLSVRLFGQEAQLSLTSDEWARLSDLCASVSTTLKERESEAALTVAADSVDPERDAEPQIIEITSQEPVDTKESIALYTCTGLDEQGRAWGWTTEVPLEKVRINGGEEAMRPSGAVKHYGYRLLTGQRDSVEPGVDDKAEREILARLMKEGAEQHRQRIAAHLLEQNNQMSALAAIVADYDGRLRGIEGELKSRPHVVYSDRESEAYEQGYHDALADILAALRPLTAGKRDSEETGG